MKSFMITYKLAVTTLFLLLSHMGVMANMGKPFFHNISALEYKGHNRNFAVECDKEGNVYVANFEGLLVYDGYNWEMYHSPAISRITSLFTAKDGRVWFGGNNVLGYTKYTKDSIEVKFLISDADKNVRFGEITSIYEKNNKIHFSASGKTYLYSSGKEYKLMKNTADQKSSNASEIRIPDQNLTVRIVNGHGLECVNDKKQVQFTLTADDGLCSNNIGDISYNGKGNVWGITDNGIFMLNVSPVYSHYTETDGIVGQVTSILRDAHHLYVGTLQGIFVLGKDNHFTKLSGITQACWHLTLLDDTHILASTTEGVFVCGDGIRQLTSRHALCTIKDLNGSIVIGELDGIYRHTSDGKDIKVSDVPNVTKLIKDYKGGIWAVSLNKETYYKAVKSDRFIKSSSSKSDITLLFSYKDKHGRYWTSGRGGRGLVSNQESKKEKQWYNPLNAYQIQAMYAEDDMAWIGGTFGVICLNLKAMKKTSPYKPVTYIRYTMLDPEQAEIIPASDKVDPIGKTLYSYRLQNKGRWSRWTENNDFKFSNLSSGNYNFTARTMDAFGNISTSRVVKFEIPTPLYRRWYAILFYVILFAVVAYGIFHWRLILAQKEKMKIEKLLNERTEELEEAHGQMVRQEKEATVGKLTKGLIDRILNPMNYINNFSHLTIGLVKDLKDNIKDDENNMTPDIYEDTVDVADMMVTNLEKIEQHGMSTTRILKAMEELLKERSGKMQSSDITQICQQSVDMFVKYFENDIKNLKIQLQWQRPDKEINKDVNAEQLNKVVNYILANSIYAVKKKHEKTSSQPKQEDYVPTIRLMLSHTDNSSEIQIAIYDNGIGIEESIMDKIFDPFFTTKPTAEAPGIGLYISQQSIQDMGGTISVKSVKDEYTEFTITLT